MNDIWSGLQAACASLNGDYKKQFGSPITMIDSIGVFAMMHGYLAFDKDDNLLVTFRTWRIQDRVCKN